MTPIVEARDLDVGAGDARLLPGERVALVGHNGAAGMPNFRGGLYGLCTRIGWSPSPHPALHQVVVAGVHVALLPIGYDIERWQATFLAQWPPAPLRGCRTSIAFPRALTVGPIRRCMPMFVPAIDNE